MLQQIAIVIPVVIFVMLVGKRLSNSVGLGPLMTGLLQTILSVIISVVLVNNGLVAENVALGMIIAPVSVTLVAGYMKRQQKERVLSGEYGEEVKWAGELDESGDEEFSEALRKIPRVEAREVAIIAESKEELRELIVERGEKYND